MTGLLALVARGSRLPTWIGVAGAAGGSCLGLLAAIQALVTGTTVSVELPWRLPMASWSIAIDPLSAFFLIPVLGLSALAAVYGAGYWRPPDVPRSTGSAWLWFNLLVASMAMVLVARNGMLFLLAWELMTLASFFLVTLDDDSSSARQAGGIYLIATHVGTAFLLVLFLMLGDRSGSLDFARFLDAPARTATGAGALFLLALIGFGVKAGFMPMHVWLPEAHPAAPAHVSALMSGAMIKLGIYGLLRMLGYIGPPSPWWGWTLLLIGLVSGLLGVLYALAQHELKRLLAYSSVENMGIIACGLGIGLLGVSYHLPFVAVLGFGAALLHVLNHAMFKGLLFLGAGAVAHGAHTGAINRLGGLLKRMPWTGSAFLVASVAIAGLPPLNGFVGEFLLYLGSLRAATLRDPAQAIAGVAVIGGLALIGGLAAACFAKAFGIVFLGEPRSEIAREAREPGLLMRIPMLLLAAACLAAALLSPRIFASLAGILPALTGLPPAGVAAEVGLGSAALGRVTIVSGVLLILAILIAALRKAILLRRPAAAVPTWDCGYQATTARMQYTESSFAQPISELFRSVLPTRAAMVEPSGPFPGESSFATTTPDSFRERVFRPLFQEIGRRFTPFRRIQEGRVQIYVLYIALTLLALLLYQFLFA